MAENPAPRPMPFTIVVPTAYGQMMVNRYDSNQTNALFKNGMAFDHAEIILLAQLLQKCNANPVFVDVGANFGTYTIALAGVVGPLGKIHSFEPQRLIYNLLVGSVAINSYTQVYCHNMAVGDRDGVLELPQFDYHKPMNFGSVEFTSEQKEPLTQTRGHDPARVETVPLTTLDRFNWSRADLMKIDAEGMEPAVLDGATETITRCRPLLYVEYLKTDKTALRKKIEAMDYKIHEAGMNFLSVPTEKTEKFPINLK